MLLRIPFNNYYISIFPQMQYYILLFAKDKRFFAEKLQKIACFLFVYAYIQFSVVCCNG